MLFADLQEWLHAYVLQSQNSLRVCTHRHTIIGEITQAQV